MFVERIDLLFGGEELLKRLNIQRILAWPLCKDDTHNRREANPLLASPLKNTISIQPADYAC